jgi:hypothetical protein
LLLINWDSFPNEKDFKAHAFGDLSVDGISKHGLVPLLDKNREPIAIPNIWCVLGGRCAFVVSHLKKHRADLLLASGNKIGLIVIAAGDYESIKQFRRYQARGHYCRKMHPVRSAQPINIYEYDVTVLDANHLPFILLETVLFIQILFHSERTQRRKQ